MPDRVMKRLATLSLCATLFLGACTTAGEPPRYRGALSAEGSSVSLHRPVEVGAMIVTPLVLVEDSRCPTDTTCVWQGRVVIEARVDGPGWSETTTLTLNEPTLLHGMAVVLVGAEPYPVAGGAHLPGDYRFTFASAAPA